MGAPACGKGTQAALLKEKYNLRHISTGDLLRREIANGTPVGKEASKIMAAGGLVPDDIVLGLLKKEVAVKGKGIVFDGYPRTIAQAQALGKILQDMKEEITSVIYLNLETEEIVKRLVSRRQCKACGNIFNIRFMKNFDGKCPKCGSKDVFQREDDNETAAKKRIDVYMKDTLPVKNFYAKEKFYSEVNANKGIQEVLADIEKVIK